MGAGYAEWENAPGEFVAHSCGDGLEKAPPRPL